MKASVQLSRSTSTGAHRGSSKRSEAQQAEDCSTDERISGSPECQNGNGSWDRHLQVKNALSATRMAVTSVLYHSFLTGLHCLFRRELIEGEDNRLSTNVGQLSLTDHLHLTNSNPSHPLATLPPPTGSLKLNGPGCAVNAETAPAAVSADNQRDGNLKQQATEKSERKTVLIR